MRCFIGIPVPREQRQALDRFVTLLKPELSSGMSWTRYSNWHVTIRFLGETGQDDVESIIAALPEVHFSPFTLQIHGAGYFPNNHRPNALWLGLRQGATECHHLFERVEVVLEPLGKERENRQFHPHLTVARIQRKRRDAWADIVRRAETVQWEPFMVDELVFWKSELGPQGPRYTRLHTVRAQT